VPTSLFAGDFQSVLDQAVTPPSPAAAPFPSPEDWRDRWIYFLMLDRFNNPLRASRPSAIRRSELLRVSGRKVLGRAAATYLHQATGRWSHLAQSGSQEFFF
jgi:hypothetical protein